MNLRRVCCICVLFSLLAGCASESSIDEKKKKAQVTQSNINKNTPQQLGNDSNLLIVFYVQIMPDDFVMQLHRF